MRFVWLAIALTLAIIIDEVVCGRDFYEILGVGRDASTREIKRAFRALSLKYHPDKNKDEGSEQKYLDIVEARDVLADPEKRQIYDKFGEEGLQEDKHTSGGFNPFSDLFGGMKFNFGGNNGQPQQKRGPDVDVPFHVTLEDLYNGREQSLVIDKQVLCHHCGGTGAKSPDHIHKCSTCGGSGMQTITRTLGPGFIQQMKQPCTACDGTGTIIKAKCEHCKGSRVERDELEVTIVVEKGMSQGDKIELKRGGDQAPDTVPGSYFFVLNQKKHAFFVRKGHELYCRMNISLLEALIGFKREIKHLDGRVLKIARDEITKPGQKVTIKGEGMPRRYFSSEKGLLVIEFTVIFPNRITEEEKKSFKQLLAKY